MAFEELISGCSADVLVSFPKSLRIYSGLLTVSTVCGGLTGILAAALLYFFCLKPLLLTRQGYIARRLLEPDDDLLVDNNNQSNGVSNSRKEATSAATNEKEKRQPPISSDVAAFATRAKVVYPINQKYRPLADGASNPSLHEHSKLPALPNDESSSVSVGESLSQEQDNDDSSQFISSSHVPKSLQNQSFIRASSYPNTLAQPGFQGRISLYCLALQDIQRHCSQLQVEKYELFLLSIKSLLSRRFPNDKAYADFWRSELQKQEKELNEHQKMLLNSGAVSEDQEDPSCTLEEIERSQKDQLERDLQESRRFSKQVEDLCQSMLKKSSFFSQEECEDLTGSLLRTLVAMENHLMDSQEAELKRIQQKLLWWEELTGLLQSQPTLLQKEVSLRQSLVATLLEQLTSDDVLAFSDMEKILSEVQATLTENLQLCTDECKSKTKELLNDRCSRMESKRRKLLRSQTKEKSRTVEQAQSNCDPQRLTKVFQELLVKHSLQISELELQQDHRVADTLCDHWKKLRTVWSKRLGDQAKHVLLASVGAQSTLSAQRFEELWLDLEHQLNDELQQVERSVKMQLQAINGHLDQDGQMWSEEMALVEACLQHLREQQMKILRAIGARQSYTLNSQVRGLIEKKHEHLLAVVRRHFTVRRFCLHLLKEMRLSRLKTLSQTDFRSALMEEPAKSHSCLGSTLKNSSGSLAERHVGPESQLVGHNFQQEFLSELETGAELLQTHAQLVLGNALSHAVQGMMEAPPTESVTASAQGDEVKRHLTEAASESVYLTKGSLSALVQSYYSNLQDIMKTLEQDEDNIQPGGNGDHDRTSHISELLLRELANWAKKPNSAKFQQRVEQHKRKVLEQSELEQERRYEDLRQKKVALDETLDCVKAQLLEAEERFMTELAALARVSLRSSDAEDSCDEDAAGNNTAAILDLIARNPALDPALNPSLTPTVITPAKKTKPKRKPERESYPI